MLKVLSTLSSHGVRHLLMGGQACVLYGATDFSRDVDVVVLVEPENFKRLDAALAELQASCIAIPPYELEYLIRGHAVHFRCAHPDTHGVRLDLMSTMRGVAKFEELWTRRSTFDYESGPTLEVLSLPDLVQAKKTRRDKDWPMIRRLIETHYFRNQDQASPARIDFWLRESRTPTMLIELAREHPIPAAELSSVRPLLAYASSGDETNVKAALVEEEEREREVDQTHWKPLLAELEELRRRRRRHDDSA